MRSPLLEVVLAAVSTLAPLGGCAIDLSPGDLEGRPCKAGACLPGYVCSANNVCMRAASGQGGSSGERAETGGTSSGGEGARAGGIPTGGAPDSGTSAGGATSIGGGTAGGTSAGGARGSGGMNAGGDHGLGAASVHCRGEPCAAGESCCVSTFPGYPNVAPADAFSCAADVTSCAYALRCDDDHDCAQQGEVCCSTEASKGWVASCAPQCDPPSIHIECTVPADCTSGSVCCGDWSLSTRAYTRVTCSSSCAGTTAYTLCASDSDCARGLQRCVEAPALPGTRYCQ